jgi:hypothetical protein
MSTFGGQGVNRNPRSLEDLFKVASSMMSDASASQKS